MPQETLLIMGANLKPIVESGEAGRIAGCDGRTFKKWAKDLKIKPAGFLRGKNVVYWRKDAEYVAKKYKEHLAEIEDKRGTS